MKYRKAIFIVTYLKDNGIKYLIFRRKLHWRGYEFSKGGLEKNETILNGLKRELFEETGQKAVKILRFNKTGKYKYPKLLRDRPEFIGQEYSLFAAEIKNKKVKIDRKEHSGYRWLEYEKALKLLTFPNQRNCLRIVNKKLMR
ncbi:MAG: NUDIX domain-containing protein [Candidatus Nanoarchaeia archaeon]|nr:NUDIX domain-containing protein [Candidatus Nanoarchaeia archaeon]